MALVWDVLWDGRWPNSCIGGLPERVSSLYFIHIATLSDTEDFVGWMEGQAKIKLRDSCEFAEWLEQRDRFPLQFYLNGITYQFEDERELALFQIGFEAALCLRFGRVK